GRSVNRLAEPAWRGKLFAETERQLDQRGLLLKRGTMIDASIVETAHRPPAPDGSRPAVDADAAHTAREGRRGQPYGYKLHAGVDQKSRLIRRLALTPANVNDTVPADELVCGDERAVYADKGYAKRARRDWLASLRIKSRIMHKSWGGGPVLTSWQIRANALTSATRAQVGGVFATLK